MAACIRLNYTINLTDSADYLCESITNPRCGPEELNILDSVSNIVIWGYGEIAVGMFCGCLATLRPLFRKMFRLGSLGTSGQKPTGGASNLPFPQNSRKTYEQFSNGRDVEMGNMGTVSNAYKGPAQDSDENFRASSMSSEPDSMDQILCEAKKQGMGNKSIVVSRQVNVDRSAA